MKENNRIEILKIERPKYEVVDSDGTHIVENEIIYRKKELLTKEEKEFLKQILQFGNYKSGTQNGIIKYITKAGYWLELNFSEFHCNSVYIDKNLYFKGLTEDEEYTLKELGLEEN